MPTQSEISLNPVSTKGGVLSSNSSSRISVAAGTNGQFFAAQSSSTSGLEYKTISTTLPAFEQIGSSVLTSNATSIIFSNIDTAVSYTSFRLIVLARTTASNGYLIIRFNDISSSTYNNGGWYAKDTSVQQTSNNSTGYIPNVTDNSSNTSVYTSVEMDIFPRGKDMGSRYPYFLSKAKGWSGAMSTSTGAQEHRVDFGYTTGITSYITKIEILGSTTLASGSSAYLYGFRR